jgi:hypothetical protein
MSEATVREVALSSAHALEYVVALHSPHRMLARVVKAHFPNAPRDMRWSLSSSVRTRDQGQARVTFAGHPETLRADALAEEIDANSAPCVLDMALHAPWYNAIILECKDPGSVVSGGACEPGSGWFIDLALFPLEQRAALFHRAETRREREDRYAREAEEEATAARKRRVAQEAAAGALAGIVNAALSIVSEREEARRREREKALGRLARHLWALYTGSRTIATDHANPDGSVVAYDQWMWMVTDAGGCGDVESPRAARGREARAAPPMRACYSATLPEHAFACIGAHLPLRSAMAFSRTCKRLRGAFPAILRRRDYSHTDAHAERTRVTMGPRIDETQLATIASWTRFYDVTLVVSPGAFGADERAMRRCVTLIRQFARCPAHWSPARWAEIGGAWTRTRPGNQSGDAETSLTSFPARWLRLDLSPTYHPDTLIEASAGTLPRTQFQAMVIETSLLNRACVTDEVVAALGNVHALDLRYTDISYAAAMLGKVHTLDLRGTRITDSGAAALCNVRVLNLSETSVTDEAALLLALGSVHTLDLSETGVTDVGAAALSKSRKLHTLRLRGTRITDVGAASLGTASTIHTLDLSETRVTAVGAAALRHVHTLTLPHLASADAPRAREPPGLLRAWVDATCTRVPLCEKSAGIELRALYAAYVRADPPVHERMLGQVCFAHMLGEMYEPRPVWARGRRLRYVYLLRWRQ